MTILTSSVFSVGIVNPFLPSWYPAVGEIVAVPSSGTTVGTAVRAEGGASYPHDGGPVEDITDPWCGGAVVYEAGQPYLISYGGGHGNSSFNGMMKFGPLYSTGSDAPVWGTWLAPSAIGDVQDAQTYADGRQSSVHTYNNIIGVGDTLYSMATDGYYSIGFSSDRCFKFTTSGQAPELPNNPRTRLFGACAYYNGNIYYHAASNSGDRLRIYNIAGNSWSTEPGGGQTFSNYVAAAADTTRGGVLVCNSSSAVYWKTSDLSRTTGISGPPSYDQSLIYDPDRDKFVSYVDASRTVYELDAATLFAGGTPSWTSRTFTGSTPSAGSQWGTYSKFNYVPELKGYTVFPKLESNVYFFRSA